MADLGWFYLWKEMQNMHFFMNGWFFPFYQMPKRKNFAWLEHSLPAEASWKENDA